MATILNGIEQTATRQIVGNLTDSKTDATLYGYAVKIDGHNHGPSYVYPTLANAVTLTAAGTAWAAFPTPTEVIPASTITVPFSIHWITVSDISANGEYEIAIYQGAALSETLLARKSFVRNAVQSQEGSLPMHMDCVVANTRISAAISSSNAAADTVGIKVAYHSD